MLDEMLENMKHNESFGAAPRNTSPSGPQLILDKIKEADRVTFIINYLYMTLRGNQLLQSDQSSGTHLIAELFLTALDSYVSIMSEWVTKGELNEDSKEFFIKPNPQVFQSQSGSKKVSSKNQWSESFIYRTINLRELMASEGMYVPSDDKNDQPKLEVSAPIFLRPVMMEILSIGKSIKILRYLETHQKS